ncbi:tRNA (guanine-N(7)-)-methyltransferase [Hathewaya proteolytica DSM 3090]|uniref:tRNA (guanine-N(7)-)-methyltransferase n=1 Tax=Hathewaya proteolytica DSM 3090 TaxID=1121331 RepID=A0A1M6Q691_9CLOT|nr:tRNA (guanosine(46)-N7)-methyltransferase TrmB [Hathewaya proteolytica]SHK15643.1 tRNA (guanine-N(7)-)-methyltransferase [Hathewaya proteolytica DSM 3090]
MRLRKNWAARPQMEASSFCIYNPYELKGKWHEVFQNENPIELELGCGRGAFITELAMKNPQVNYIAVDLKDEVLIYVLRKIEENNIENIRIMPINIMLMKDVFDKDEINKIYLNFSTPWPKDRHNKRRLTYGIFLNMYKEFLVQGGEIWFKTDNEPFFNDSLQYFKSEGFSIEYLTYNLHESEYDKINIKTEYETKFSSMGMKIMFCIARLK